MYDHKTPIRTSCAKAGVACRYHEHEDRFLRINFADETLQPLFHHEISGAIATWIKRVLTHGIHFAGGKYVFLAFSSSQLREHGAWFYREPVYGEHGIEPGMPVCFPCFAVLSFALFCLF